MTLSIIEYHRVSKEDKYALLRLGLAAQAKATADYLDAQGWKSAGLAVDDGVSARKIPLEQRPAMADAMARLARGEADGIIAAFLDRFARNAREFATILEAANHKKTGFVFVAIDLGVDTSTTDGKLMAQWRAAMAEWEGNKISDRTKAALAAKKAAGVKLGRPREIPDSVAERVRELKGEQMSTRAIARQLDADGLLPPGGGSKWSHQTVASLLLR